RATRSISRLRAAAGAPIIATALLPRELASEWLELDAASPHGLYELPLRRERLVLVRAFARADGCARILTIDRAHAPRLHALLHAFGARTGIPILLETELSA